MSLRRIAFFALLFISISAFSEERASVVSCKAESPVDGSLWIGTRGEGIFRLGRNGRKAWYHVESGQLSSDEIISLGFDKSNVLWILDGTGSFTNYTSVGGFKQIQSFPEKIYISCFSSDLSKLYFCTEDSQLFVYDLVDGNLIPGSKLPALVTSLFSSSEDNAVWGLSQKGAFKANGEGILLTWDANLSPLELIPFEFDTNQPQEASRAHKGVYYLLLLIAVILFIALVSVLYIFLLSGRRSKQSEAKPDVVKPAIAKPAVAKPSVVKPQDVSKPLPAPVVERVSTPARASVPLNKLETPIADGEFTKKVKALVDEHLSEPDFDVDAIAQITGLSRIHVNRKLKAEGSPSPSVMLKDARMSLAAKLLKEGRLSVAQVGNSCGFSRASYFATAFKEYFNVSPSDFQNAPEA